MTFEVYRSTYARRSPEPMLTVTSAGVIAMNAASFQAMGCPEAVRLMYDRAECLIGLQPAPKDAPEAYAVGHQSGGGVHVSARSYSRHYGLIGERARRFVATWQDDTLIADLNQDSAQAVTGNRTKRPA